MLRSSSSDRRPSTRAQTEPLAAIVAVSAIVVGISLYAVSIGDVHPGTSDRTPERTAIERIWSDLEDDERGVFPASEYETATDRKLREAIDQDSLPDGWNVYVEVSGYRDGAHTVFAAAHFDSTGETLHDQQIPSTHEDFGPPGGPGDPTDPGVATREIPVELAPADVRSGTLHVEVWDS